MPEPTRGSSLFMTFEEWDPCVRGASCGARGSGAIAVCRVAHGASRVAAVFHARVDTKGNIVGNVGIMMSCVGSGNYEPSAEVYGEMGGDNLLWWPLTATLDVVGHLDPRKSAA